MKEKFQQFMTGRYGVDELSRFTLYGMIVLLILNLFIRSSLLNLLLALIIVYMYFRMFSKNYQKRYQENVKFLQAKEKFLGFFRREKNLAQQRKTHHIYTCPSCKQKIRIPKGKGKIQITCPKCHTQFIKRS